jgi:hypothetical protein
MRQRHPIGLYGLAVIAVAASTVSAALALDGEDPKDIIAAQLRDQGYACDTPQSAKPDENASGPDEAAWIVTCESATYRVKLVPDMAAKVEKIDQNGKKPDQKN